MNSSSVRTVPLAVHVVIDDERWVEWVNDLVVRTARAAETAFAHALIQDGGRDGVEDQNALPFVRQSRASCQEKGPSECLYVTFGDDAMVRHLNQKWRGTDAPTDVLSFPLWQDDAPLPYQATRVLGDVMIAYETVMADAANSALEHTDYIIHLVVHGTLHILGYDHQTPPDAEAMERAESLIMERLGYDDPWRA